MDIGWWTINNSLRTNGTTRIKSLRTCWLIIQYFCHQKSTSHHHFSSCVAHAYSSLFSHPSYQRISFSRGDSPCPMKSLMLMKIFPTSSKPSNFLRPRRSLLRTDRWWHNSVSSWLNSVLLKNSSLLSGPRNLSQVLLGTHFCVTTGTLKILPGLDLMSRIDKTTLRNTITIQKLLTYNLILFQFC